MKRSPLRRLEGWMPLAADRFWAKTDRTGDCWVWLGKRNPDGYGEFYRPHSLRPPRTLKAHRFAYLVTVGPIPAGLELDHLCRNRACVRPDHLEAVTREVNMQRGVQARQGNRCRNGHEKTPENTKVATNGTGRTFRACRTCLRIHSLAAYHRKKAAA